MERALPTRCRTGSPNRSDTGSRLSSAESSYSDSTLANGSRGAFGAPVCRREYSKSTIMTWFFLAAVLMMFILNGDTRPGSWQLPDDRPITLTIGRLVMVLPTASRIDCAHFGRTSYALFGVWSRIA